MIGIVNELKRRNVVRVAAAYMVVSWVMIQVTDVAVPALLLPEWAASFVFFLLAAGFPIAMIAAWAFEMTPEGLRRTKGGEAVPKGAVRIGDFVMLGAVVCIAGAVVYSVFLSGGGSSTAERKVSGSAIAVLPFQNLSVEAEEAMFSQALTSDIRNRLGLVPGLQVASRSASIQFADGASHREIARVLDVAAVLEGSVQKVGDRIRVTALLIDTKDGYQAWSATVDREVTDLLAVQDAISAEISAQVSSIMAGEAVEVAAEAVEQIDPVAVMTVARQDLQLRTPQALERALTGFNRVIASDANLADAYAGAAEAYLHMARSPESYGNLDVEDALARARPYMARAQELAPGAAYVLAVDGLLQLTSGHTGKALALLDLAAATDPALAEAHLWLHATYLAEGNPLDAYASLERAYEIAPGSLPIALNMSRLLVAKKELRRAEGLISSLAQTYPENVNVVLARAALLADLWQPVQAVDLLRKARLDAPGNRAVRLMLGLTLLDIGEDEEAGRLLDGLGQWAVLSQGKVTQALTQARGEYRAQPGSRERAYALADLEAIAGHDDTVVDLLEPYNAGPAASGSLFARAPILLPTVTLAQARHNLGDDAGADALLQKTETYLAMHRAAGIDGPKLNYLEARVHAVRGDTQAAMASLSRAILHRFPGISIVRWDPALASLRGLSEYQALVSDLEGEQAQQRQSIASALRGSPSSPRGRDRAANEPGS
ncbi:MAG: tetratricopeptide repeat protein [Alphaproteobacteria bacterium]